MNHLKISLSAVFDSVPPDCRITCCGKELFNSRVTGDTELEFDIGSFKKFNLQIEKAGKTVALVDKEERQIISITNINLNGIDLKIKEFGLFEIKGNPYVNDHSIQTNELHLNGVWTMTLPSRTLVGNISHRLENIEMRDTLMDCDVACFGCVQTHGWRRESNISWPHQLKLLTGLYIMNYGIYSSNTNEITSLVEHYIKNFKAETILLYLPHNFKRQVIKEGEYKNVGPQDPVNKELLWHGEEHSIAVLTGELYQWLEKISSHTKIFFGTYHPSEYDLYHKTKLKKYMIPNLNHHLYPNASDNQHIGEEFHIDLAKNIKKFLQLG